MMICLAADENAAAYSLSNDTQISKKYEKNKENGVKRPDLLAAHISSNNTLMIKLKSKESMHTVVFTKFNHISQQ